MARSDNYAFWSIFVSRKSFEVLGNLLFIMYSLQQCSSVFHVMGKTSHSKYLGYSLLLKLGSSFFDTISPLLAHVANMSHFFLVFSKFSGRSSLVSSGLASFLVCLRRVFTAFFSFLLKFPSLQNHKYFVELSHYICVLSRFHHSILDECPRSL